MRITLVILLFAIIGCGEDEESKSTAKATINFAESTSLALLEEVSSFSLSLKSIQLVNNVDGKDATNVWLNPKCSDSAACNSTTTDYYDMIDVAAVNKVLNDEAEEFELASETMTFKYVRFYICGTQTATSQLPIQWSGGSVTDGLSESNFCVFDSAEMSPPLSISDGESATIELSYDLTGDRVYPGTEIEEGKTRSTDYETHYNACSVDDDDEQWCFDVPTIAAKVVVD